MIPTLFRIPRRRMAMAVAVACALVARCAAAGEPLSAEHHAALRRWQQEVAALLRTGDVRAFRGATVPRLEELQRMIPGGMTDLQSSRSAARYLEIAERCGRRLIGEAREAGVEWGQASIGWEPDAGLRVGHDTVEEGGPAFTNTWLRDVVFTLRVTAAGPGTVKTQESGVESPRWVGSYQIQVAELLLLEGHWRSTGMIQWIAFPERLGGEAQKRALLYRRRQREGGAIVGSEDPALQRGAEAFLALLSDGNVDAFRARARWNRELALHRWQAYREPPPAIEEFEASWKKGHDFAGEQATRFLTEARALGLDFTGATLALLDVQAAGLTASQSDAVITAREVRVRFACRSGGRLSGGRSLLGEYSISFDPWTWYPAGWGVTLGGATWNTIPEEAVGTEVAERLRVEQHAEKTGGLPPGFEAPKVTLFEVGDGTPVELRSFRGSWVVLDFWATWCGPCQPAMQRLQGLVEKHPEWANEVLIITVSVDAARDTAAKHLARRGWNRTRNFWGGEGGSEGAVPSAFRVQGVPTSYLIDREGRVVEGGLGEADFEAALARRVGVGR